MKRIFIYQLNKPYSAAASSYIRQMIDGFLNVCSTGILLTNDSAWQTELAYAAKLHFHENIPEGKRLAIQTALEQQPELVILFDDQMMGPVFPMDEMESRIETRNNAPWILAQGASMIGIPANNPNATTLALEYLNCPPEQRRNNTISYADSMQPLYDLSEFFPVSETPFMDLPLKSVRDKKCPFFFPDIFWVDYQTVLRKSLGFMTRDFYRFLKNNWDVNPLWDYLLSSVHQQDIMQNLHLMHFIPTQIAPRAQVDHLLETQRVALIMHLDGDLLEQTLDFSKRMIPQADVYITTTSEEKKTCIEAFFNGFPCAKFEVRVIASSPFVGFAEIIPQYDYVCYYQEPENAQGDAFAGAVYQCQENLIASQDFVRNVIKTFADNPRLGMLSPPPPHHANYFFTMGNFWGENYEVMKKFCNTMEWTVPLSKNKKLLAPFNTCFWFRPNALAPLFDANWGDENFPAELNDVIRYIYAACVQEAGYYPAYLMSDTYAQLEDTNLHYYVREYHKVITKEVLSYHEIMCAVIKEKLE